MGTAHGRRIIADVEPAAQEGTAGMLCREIHADPEGCDGEIPSSHAWRYCARCGRPTWHIPQSEGRIIVFEGRPEIHTVSIRNIGVAPVFAHIELHPSVDGVHLAQEQPPQVLVRPDVLTPVRIHVPALVSSCALGYLAIKPRDTELLSAEDPWERIDCHAVQVQLLADVRQPAAVRVVQELAVFREGVPEREIEVLNEGAEVAHVAVTSQPRGYDLIGASATIPSEARHVLRVRRRWGDGTDAQAALVLRTSDGCEHTVLLCCPPLDGPTELTRAVIGVDFGTAFSSIAFRQCLHRNDEAMDVVDLIRPLGEDDDRFPTRVWLGRSHNEIEFGSAATKRSIDEPLLGFLFREIKALLRLGDLDESDHERVAGLIHPQGEGAEAGAVAIAQRRYGERWPEGLVTDYLGWLYRSVIIPELRRRFDAENLLVRYVFSLPVLDYATDGRLYGEQRRSMKACIDRAGFPIERVEFQFEPVCAALGLLYPPEGEWSRLGTKEHPASPGDSVVVVDSGGGTTDVVLARTEVSEGGRVSLRIERCLGLGSRGETFGGEEVTTGLIQAFDHPEKLPRGWWGGDEPRLELMAPIGGTEGDLRVRDWGEDAKVELAASSEGGISIGDTTVLPSLLEQLVLEPLTSLGQELDDRVFSTQLRGRVSYYLCVGGNTCLPPVERWARRFMQDSEPVGHSRRELRIPERYRKLAVAYGGPWVPTARIRNAVPYGLRILFDGEERLWVAPNTAEEVYEESPLYHLPPRGQMRFEFRAVYDGHERRVAEGRFFNPNDVGCDLALWLDVQNGSVRLRCREEVGEDRDPGEAKLLVSYQL